MLRLRPSVTPSRLRYSTSRCRNLSKPGKPHARFAKSEKASQERGPTGGRGTITYLRMKLPLSVVRHSAMAGTSHAMSRPHFLERRLYGRSATMMMCLVVGENSIISGILIDGPGVPRLAGQGRVKLVNRAELTGGVLVHELTAEG